MAARKLAPNKVGRPNPPLLDPVAVAADLEKLKGNLSAVARKHGVTRGAVQHLVRRTPALAAVVADAREGFLDDAEGALQKAVRKGEAWAVCFTLKCLARDRGYIEKVPESASPDAVADFLAAVDARRDAREHGSPARASDAPHRNGHANGVAG